MLITDRFVSRLLLPNYSITKLPDYQILFLIRVYSRNLRLTLDLRSISGIYGE